MGYNSDTERASRIGTFRASGGRDWLLIIEDEVKDKSSKLMEVDFFIK